MDLYLTSTEPGLTLQEMIDCDIKSGVDFESGFPGDPLLGAFDFPNMPPGFESELDLKSFEPLFDPLIHVEDDAMDSQEDGRVLASDTSPIASWMNFSSMTNFNLDLETSVMVNPSVVLPSAHHPPTKKHQTPAIIPGSIIKMEQQLEIQNSPKKPETYMSAQPSPVTTQVVLRPVSVTSTNSPVTVTDTQLSGIQSSTIITNSSASHRPITGPASPQSLSSNHQHRQIVSSNGSLSPNVNGTLPVQSAFYRSSTSLLPTTTNRSKPSAPKYRRERTPDDKTYPKPAYSYACLIALALKNSLTGSLPVSEIYNFMCEHFPYFRTAPNGWKNSVRHNLSLNKCFEKIEKPVVSGSNQRKGCLWALNPLKIHKMDEEVQKWSKKDLQGIRDAMTCPEILESLEKGEMKFESTSGASSCSEDSEDEDATIDLLSFGDAHSQVIHPPIKVISSSTTLSVPQSINSNNQVSRVPQNGFTQLGPKFSSNQFQETDFFAVKNGNLSRINRLQQQPIVSSSPEPEFILPDSTLPEINIQSNGTLVDDFGNEIVLDGDLSILNPRSTIAGATSVTSTAGSTTNLILKKVNASSPLRSGASSSAIRSHITYATAHPGLAPHQNGHMSRLVLTNARLS